MLEQEVVYDYADVGGEELGALDPRVFGFGLRVDLAVVQRQHSEVAGRSVAISFFNVTTLLHRGDGWSISGRSSNAQFFQALDKAGFCVTRRVL